MSFLARTSVRTFGMNVAKVATMPSIKPTVCPTAPIVAAGEIGKLMQPASKKTELAKSIHSMTQQSSTSSRPSPMLVAQRLNLRPSAILYALGHQNIHAAFRNAANTSQSRSFSWLSRQIGNINFSSSHWSTADPALHTQGEESTDQPESKPMDDCALSIIDEKTGEKIPLTHICNEKEMGELPSASPLVSKAFKAVPTNTADESESLKWVNTDWPASRVFLEG